MTVKIIVDSTCDLPQELIDDYNIEVLPLRVHIDGREYLDGVELTTTELYTKMREGKHPKTSQVSPKQFKDCFMQHAQNGDKCIYLSFSSKLSGTYQTALLINNELKEIHSNFKLEIIDSKAGSTGIGLIALQAARLSKLGRDLDYIVNTVKYQCHHIEHLFVIDNLHWLYEGGRLSKTSALLGELLNIKPILHLRDGKIEVLKKVRGKKKTLNTVIDIVEKRIGNFKDQIIGISHADDLPLALKVKDMLEERLDTQHFIINIVGSVLGSHLGISGVGILFLNSKPEEYVLE